MQLVGPICTLIAAQFLSSVMTGLGMDSLGQIMLWSVIWLTSIYVVIRFAVGAALSASRRRGGSSSDE